MIKTFIQKIKLFFALNKLLGGHTMDATEVIAAISAVESLLPAIEKGYADLKVVVADLEGLLATFKEKVDAVKNVTAK